MHFYLSLLICMAPLSTLWLCILSLCIPRFLTWKPSNSTQRRETATAYLRGADHGVQDKTEILIKFPSHGNTDKHQEKNLCQLILFIFLLECSENPLKRTDKPQISIESFLPVNTSISYLMRRTMPSEKLVTSTFILHFFSIIYLCWNMIFYKYESTGLSRCELRASTSHFSYDFLQEAVFFPV